MPDKTLAKILIGAGLAVILPAPLAQTSSRMTHDPDNFTQKRRQMVSVQLKARDITNERVLNTMAEVPRHLFVAPSMRAYAYADNALPIEEKQTISQPYIVALMTQLARLEPQDKVLEIGTGSGYQAAVLSRLVKKVYSIEINEYLAQSARRRLAELGYDNVVVRRGDGWEGWPEEAPFDAIIVTAAPEEIPPKLIAQLKAGGRLVIPVGDTIQELLVLTKQPDGLIVKESIIPVRFVPMVRGKDDH